MRPCPIACTFTATGSSPLADFLIFYCFIWDISQKGASDRKSRTVCGTLPLGNSSLLLI